MLLNEFRVGYSGSFTHSGLVQPGVPSIRFDDSTVGFGTYNGHPQFFKEHIYTYAEMVSISREKHSIKMGVDLRRMIVSVTQPREICDSCYRANSSYWTGPR